VQKGSKKPISSKFLIVLLLATLLVVETGIRLYSIEHLDYNIEAVSISALCNLISNFDR